MKKTVFLFCLIGLTGIAEVMDFELSRYVTARRDVSGVLQPVGYLAPGARVRIVEEKRNFAGDEEQIMSWLKTGGELRYFQSQSGVKKDYFYPVEIVEAAESKGVATGSVVYVSMRYLAKRKGLELVVTQNTEVVSARPAFLRLQRALEPFVKRVEKKVKRNVANRRTPSGPRLKNCPISFEKFEAEVAKIGKSNRVPKELLLSIMQIESGGNCLSLRRELNGTSSVGLFQVNTGSTSVSPCTAGQLEALQNADDIESIRCLENPLTNLSVAVEILRDKYASVNTRKQPVDRPWQGMDEGERDAWRKALSAYNGGQAYVFQAYRDIRSFNRRAGTQLDPNNWEHRRLFFLRRWLARNVQSEFFDRRVRVKRRLYETVLNLAYVESITGRRGSVGLVDDWAKGQTVKVATAVEF